MGGAEKGRVLFSCTVLVCTHVGKGLACVMLALLLLPLKTVLQQGEILLSPGDCGAAGLLQSERMPLGCPMVPAEGESIPQHLTVGEGGKAAHKPFSALQH